MNPRRFTASVIGAAALTMLCAAAASAQPTADIPGFGNFSAPAWTGNSTELGPDTIRYWHAASGFGPDFRAYYAANGVVLGPEGIAADSVASSA